MLAITTVTHLSPAQKEQLRSLWNKEYPVKLAHTTAADTDNYLATLTHPCHYLAADDESVLYAWAASFTRDGETWFSIIVDGNFQKQGIGHMLLNALKANNDVLNGWVADHNNDVKADGTPYPSPLAFYLKNGFTICEGVRLELEILSAAKIRWVRS